MSFHTVPTCTEHVTWTVVKCCARFKAPNVVGHRSDKHNEKTLKQVCVYIYTHIHTHVYYMCSMYSYMQKYYTSAHRYIYIHIRIYIYIYLYTPSQIPHQVKVKCTYDGSLRQGDNDRQSFREPDQAPFRRHPPQRPRRGFLSNPHPATPYKANKSVQAASYNPASLPARQSRCWPSGPQLWQPRGAATRWPTRPSFAPEVLVPAGAGLLVAVAELLFSYLVEVIIVWIYTNIWSLI